jgi:hypothetical protein
MSSNTKWVLLLSVLRLLVTGCEQKERPPGAHEDRHNAQPASIGVVSPPVKDRAQGATQTSVLELAGYVETGPEYTVFRECGSKDEFILSVVHGDVADKFVRAKIEEREGDEGVLLGSGAARVVTNKRVVEGPFSTFARVEFLSFSPVDRCPDSPSKVESLRGMP